MGVDLGQQGHLFRFAFDGVFLNEIGALDRIPQVWLKPKRPGLGFLDQTACFA